MDNRVYGVRCADYAEAEKNLGELLDMMGGLGPFIEPGQKVALKVNLLRPARPEEAVCTHFAVAGAVARRVMAAAGRPVIVDSPGSGYKFNVKTLEKIYQKSGMDKAAEESGAELNFDTEVVPVSFPEGRLTRRFEVIGPIVKADVVLNLSKLKTHCFMHVTGAVKNNFGVIAGLHKPGYHAKLQDPTKFAGMLLDLAAYVSPKLSIMDAVVAMEGEGPGMGDPRPVGLLLAGENQLALDVVASEVMGVPPENNPVLLEAERRGLTPTRLEDVDLIGLDKGRLRVDGFKLPATIYGGTGFAPTEMNFFQRMMTPLFKTGLTVKPKVITKSCVGCESCYEACPMEAIDMVAAKKGQNAQIDDDKCIRCYCCHEMCPEKAITLKRSLMHRIVNP